MAKSNMDTVAEAIRIVSSLDRKGKLVVLRDLLKQDLEPKKKTPSITATVPVTYMKEGEE